MSLQLTQLHTTVAATVAAVAEGIVAGAAVVVAALLLLSVQSSETGASRCRIDTIDALRRSSAERQDVIFCPRRLRRLAGTGWHSRHRYRPFNTLRSSHDDDDAAGAQRDVGRHVTSWRVVTSHVDRPLDAAWDYLVEIDNRITDLRPNPLHTGFDNVITGALLHNPLYIRLSR